VTDSKRRAYRYHVALIVLTAAISSLTVAVRSTRGQLHSDNKAAATPSRRVTVVAVGQHDEQESVTLPTSIEPAEATSIYARASGYVGKWLVDIGSRVTRGQVLAHIESPEIDQQLAQARADVIAARTNSDLALRSHARWKQLLERNLVSSQYEDEKATEASEKAAVAESAQAVYGKLQVLSQYREVTAPFDGVITYRRANVGQLVGGTSDGGAGELFRIVSTARLRAIVHVPQTYARFVALGTKVTVTLPDRVGQSYIGTIGRTATVLDPSTRNMLVQVLIDNPGGEILPGSYAEAHFQLAPDAHVLRVPSAALLFRSSQTEVALVGAKDVVEIRPVTVGRDTGDEVEVLDGLRVGDHLVVNAPDSLASGETVLPVVR
jgi:RND family efflux transporter MFP subunit